MKKKCFKCLKVKDLKQFYAHPRMADGHLNKCKSCAKSDVQIHRYENIDKVRAYDRLRGLTDDHRAVNRKNYKKRTSTPEGRSREFQQTKVWQENNRHKRNAHIAVGNALHRGAISKDGASCERCGTTELLHAHHEDYYKPLEINWLCRACHGIRHQEINHERRR